MIKSRPKRYTVEILCISLGFVGISVDKQFLQFRWLCMARLYCFILNRCHFFPTPTTLLARVINTTGDN